MAFAYDGAWAEYTVAQAVGLTRVPDNVPLQQAAILVDAVSTPFGAVVRTGQVGLGESSACGASAGSAPTSSSWRGWSARCR
jgi:Zn-dependent alcohol dehydrogenase